VSRNAGPACDNFVTLIISGELDSELMLFAPNIFRVLFPFQLFSILMSAFQAYAGSNEGLVTYVSPSTRNAIKFLLDKMLIPCTGIKKKTVLRVIKSPAYI